MALLCFHVDFTKNFIFFFPENQVLQTRPKFLYTVQDLYF